jgi:hypothetical protein
MEDTSYYSDRAEMKNSDALNNTKIADEGFAQY